MNLGQTHLPDYRSHNNGSTEGGGGGGGGGVGGERGRLW